MSLHKASFVAIVCLMVLSWHGGFIPGIAAPPDEKTLVITPLAASPAASAVTPTPDTDLLVTPTPTAIPLGFPGNPVTSNAEWKPYIEQHTREINGVIMVIVPVGCFMMGTEESQEAYVRQFGTGDRVVHEQPPHEICFDAPFWLDRTEVTNEQYGSSGYWNEDDFPRETVDWFEARAYCESRGARLPTEAEWEYAARGPDAPLNPWGNDLTIINAVYSHVSRGQAAPVASNPDGVSWVGAYDLIGNVWEWVSTIYDQDDFPYPYATADGREDGDRSDVERVMRGGSWGNDSVSARAAYRGHLTDFIKESAVGFRCALSFSD